MQNDNLNTLLSEMFDHAVNQAIKNQNTRQRLLPEDQKQAQDEILSAIHSLFESRDKIKPEYIQQVNDAIILKIAAEFNRRNGGNRT